MRLVPLGLLALGSFLFALPARAQQAGYDPERGAFLRSSDGGFAFHPYAMVQLQHTAPFGDTATREGFAVRSAKWVMRAYDRSRDLTFHYQLNVGDGRAVAEDVFVRWEPTAWLSLTAGQIEVPFNRQHVTPQAYQQLIDRSTVDARFGLQRDQGLSLRLRFGAVDLTLGAWNGARKNVADDDPTLLETARLAWSPFGAIPFEESDVANSPRPLLSLAAAAAWNPRRSLAPDPDRPQTLTEQRRIGQAVLEVTLRYAGLSLTTEVHARRFESGTGTAVDYGELLQAGWFLLPKRLEVAGRLARSTGAVGPNEPVQEATAGLNLFLHGRRLEVSSTWTTTTLRRGTREQRVRSQLEVFF